MFRKELVTSFGTSEIMGVQDRFSIEEYIIQLKEEQPVVVFTDAHILTCHPWMEDLADIVIIPQGEESKSLSEIEKAAGQLIEMGLGRNGHLVSFGGGAVCDFTGFLASIYKRGISYSHIPTTLLAQVDASIGGKNGVNIGALKNMLGVFSAPEKIIIEPSLTFTQEPADWISGMAEVVKHSLIYDASLYDFLVENTQAILTQNVELVSTMVLRALNVKLDVVSRDDKESGLRKLLNFGHSIGHAIERDGGYRHGEAVSIGMVAELQWAHNHSMGQTLGFSRAEALLQALGLPTKSSIQNDQWKELLRADKKSDGQDIDMILVEEVGRARVEKFTLDEVASFFEERALHG